MRGHRAHGYRPRPGDRLIQDRNDAYREIVEWYPKHVKVRVYNENRGEKQDVILPKSGVAIIENPFLR